MFKAQVGVEEEAIIRSMFAGEVESSSFFFFSFDGLRVGAFPSKGE